MAVGEAAMGTAAVAAYIGTLLKIDAGSTSKINYLASALEKIIA